MCTSGDASCQMLLNIQNLLQSLQMVALAGLFVVGGAILAAVAKFLVR
jgi:hypothetical protein